MKRKQFLKGMEQVAQEGAIQIFKTPYTGMEEMCIRDRDVHTHMDIQAGAHRAVDDFYTGTVAAACGGTTTTVSYTHLAACRTGAPGAFSSARAE